MAGISKQVWVFLVATSAIAPLVHASEPPPVHYDIGLDVHNNDVEAITVRATLRAGDNGVVDFDPPWQGVAEVHAEAGKLDASVKGRWRVTTQPGGNVVLAWRTGKPERIDTKPWNIWQRIADQSHAVVALGGAFLASPVGARSRHVTASVFMPEGWQSTTGLDTQVHTVASSSQTSFLAAHGLRTATRSTAAGTTLRVSATGPHVPDVDQLATTIADALNRLGDATSNGAGTPLTLNITTFNGRDGLGWNLTGAGGVLYLSESAKAEDALVDVIRSFAVAEQPDTNPRNAWFTQGVTAYRVTTLMRDEKRLDDIAFASHMDQTIVAYGGSPLRRASNTRVVEEYEHIQEIHDLPLTRGELFAWRVDAQMREATHGQKRLTDALHRMDAGAQDPGPALIAAVAAEGGGDIAPLYRRYIVDGELLQLPPDALGPCFSIGTVADIYGWQVQHVFAKPPSLCVGAQERAVALP
jgi:hypothetical protein